MRRGFVGVFRFLWRGWMGGFYFRWFLSGGRILVVFLYCLGYIWIEVFTEYVIFGVELVFKFFLRLVLVFSSFYKIYLEG